MKIEDCKPKGCKYCGSNTLHKIGTWTRVGGQKVQRYRCTTCGRSFI